MSTSVEADSGRSESHGNTAYQGPRRRLSLLLLVVVILMRLIDVRKHL